MTAAGTRRRECAIRSDKSLGLPDSDKTLLHGVVGDGDWLGLGSKGDLKLVDSEEDSSGGISHDEVEDKRPLRTPNLGLAQHIDFLQVLLHRFRVGGILWRWRGEFR